MPFSEALLPEYDQEMAGARKTLERVPDDKLGWKPHPKSGTMGWLAAHVANIPGWTVITINQDALDMAPNGVQTQPPPEPKSRKELLEVFDKNVAEGRKAIAGASDAHLLKMWSLLNNGATIVAMPRIACLDVGDEPPDSSSRAAWRVSAFEQPSGAVDLRAICGRRQHVVEALKWDQKPKHDKRTQRKARGHGEKRP